MSEVTAIIGEDRRCLDSDTGEMFCVLRTGGDVRMNTQLATVALEWAHQNVILSDISYIVNVSF